MEIEMISLSVSVKGRGLITCILLLSIYLPAAPKLTPLADDYFVDDTGSGIACTQSAPCSLSNALGAATAGDNIYLAGGTYTGTGNEVIYLDQPINLYGGWNGSLAYPPERDHDFIQSIIDGENARRGITIMGNGIDALDPEISGLYITNGNASGLTTNCDGLASSPSGCGGGVFIYQASPFMESNRIFENTASKSGTMYTSGYGGGIYARDCVGARFTNNRIYSNVADDTNQGMGGGVSLHGSDITTQFDHNLVFDNSAGLYLNYSWGAGLALSLFDNSHIHHNEFSGNGVLDMGTVSGGGIYLWYGKPQIEYNLITGNQGEDAVFLGRAEGGGSFYGNRILDNPSSAGLTLQYSPRAGSGCGSLEYLYVYNNFIAKSTQTGLRIIGSPTNGLCAKVFHNTIDGDEVGVNLVGDFELQFNNNIISNQSSIGVNLEFGASSPMQISHNLFYNNLSNGLVGSSDLTSGNPHYIDAASGNYHIWCDSAAFDAGDGSVVAEIDIDGQVRPQFTEVDIGADECAPLFYLPLILRH
jgi:hypothetical protein